MSEHFWVFFTSDPSRFRGKCAVCEVPFDEGGCRVGERLISRDPALTRGIVEIREAWCARTPTAPVSPCPSCGERA